MDNPGMLKLNNWKFKARGDHEWLPATVPGTVHTDLLRNGRIPEPFYGTNEKELQWIDKTDWEYETLFNVTEELANAANAELVFDGLDTYADVYFNDRLVLSADNMFRVWRADVKPLLKRSNNKLKIRFRSPINEDLPKLEKLGYPLPAANDASETGGLGDKKVSIFARKAPYHYGWDWGPRFVSSGIWREARLECWSGSRITDLFIRQDQVSAASAKLTAVVEVESDSEMDGRIRIASGHLKWEHPARLVRGTQTFELDLEIAEPKLWWCRGLGEQHLYEFKAVIEDVGPNRAVAEKTVKTGLRSVRWATEKDAQGAAFHLELNGVPVFAKGANHIPNDSFTTEVTRERYRHEIASAAESNMNMLRVWGGGIYENDEFYEVCDEYGLMVWQDFMFACSMYPGDEAFLQNVRIEGEENVRRLRNHPSIVLWCGNNEIDGAWAEYDDNAGWGWKKQYTPEIRAKIWNDYEAVFHRILPDVVASYAPGAFYWPSSPIVALTGDKNQHATSRSSSGDIHYWGVWHAKEPFANYNVNIGRFMSEYGFQSFPEPRTVSSYAKESDMELESEVMLCHQKNGRGNTLIKSYMDMYLKEPKNFESFLHMSQVLQALGIKEAIEAHRRKKPYTMGSLYWQMNDCWPVASWAGMDYYGRWKALQYGVRKSFRDVSLSIDGTGDKVNFHVISDTLTPVAGNLRVRLYDFGGRMLKECNESAAVEANCGRIVWSRPHADFLQDNRAEQVVLYAVLEQDGRIIDEKTFYFVPDRDMELGVPAIRLKPVEGSNGARFTLETDVLASHVWLSAEKEGIFSDNDFDLIPGIPRTVEFLERAGEGSTAAFVPASPGRVTVQSMADWIKRV